ncbi:hypothetical protein EQH57_0196 [Dictyocoela roeselum]|nr:hypothetical protein EQH57_0196 [Dictyocoela roeselum]
MLFSGNSLFTFKKLSQNERAGKSNQKDKSFYDKVERIGEVNNGISANKNVDNYVTRSSLVGSSTPFYRNMKERQIKIEIFMIEGEDGFENLSLRSKMTQIMKRSSSDIKSWFYEMGIDGSLPKTYEDFKSKFVDFCSGQSLDNMVKYREELWSAYLERLRCVANERNIGEDEIFRKLRSEKHPKTLQMIFYSFNVTFKDVIERVLEWEIHSSDNRINKTFISQKEQNKPAYSKISSIRCFKCNELGHYSNKCTKKGDMANNVEPHKSFGRNLDTEDVIIDGKTFNAIFDTGASESVITSKILTQITNKKIINKNEEFTLINGTKVNVTRAVILELKYRERCFEETFNIIENDNMSEILICNSLVKKLRDSSNIPVECCIDTNDNLPVSWSRPIRSYKDKIDFQKLITELEKKELLRKANLDG